MCASRAASKPPDRDAKHFCFVSEVLGDAGTREDDNPDRHRLQQLIVALEGRGLICANLGIHAPCRIV